MESMTTRRPFGSGMRTIYYLLVAFNILTILISAYLNYQLSRSDRRTLEKTERSATHLGRISELELAAGRVDAPGNDIFESHDIGAERSRLQSAVGAFQESMRLAVGDATGDPRTLAHLQRADGFLALMERDTETIFALFEQGRIQDAGLAMATMDREYSGLRRELAQVRSFYRNTQSAEFRQRALRNRELAQEQTGSIVLASILLLALLAYGRRLRQEIVSSQEREEYVKTLQERKEQLRLAISERDARSEELSRSQNLLGEAQRIAHMSAWEWEPATGRVWWSDELYRMLGVEPGSVEPSYAAYMSVVAPEDSERVAFRLGQMLKDHQPFEHEYSVLMPDGERRVHRTAARVDVDGDGNVLRMFGVAQDVTERHWAETQLLRQETQLAEAQRLARVGSWELDIATGNVVWSDVLFEVLGYASGEVGPSFKAYMSLLPEEERKRVYGLLEKAMARGDRFEFEHSLVRADGEAVWLFVQGLVTRDSEGSPIRVLGVSQDITERKTAERDLRLSEERFQLASRATNDVIWDRDLVTGKLWVNESFSSRLGYPQWGDIDLESWHQGLHPADEARVREGLRQAIESDVTIFNSQYRFRAFDGTWRDVLDRGHIVRNAAGKAVRMIGASMDISERRAIDRMKDEFISTVSHELRTPLTSIRGALGLLSSGRLGDLPEKGQRLLEIASNNTDRLVRLINDILDIERIESGKVTLTKTLCDGGTLAHAAADVVRQLADRQQITIAIDATAAPLLADSDRMIQTLTNLLGNAVKFSPSGSTIRVTVRADGPTVVFAVADQGRGIPAEKLGTIFERFQQVDASDSRDKGGSGLGLTISRSIVRQHGGEITAESEAGSGSTFTIVVPSGVTHDAVALVPRKEKIVFVWDDDAVTRQVLESFLEDRGYTVREMDSGPALLAAAARQKPDAIILDLFIPHPEAREMLARLQRDPDLSGIPLIVVSVEAKPDLGGSRPLSGWVQKPLDEEVLADVFDRTLRHDRRRPRLMLVEDDADLASIIVASLERYGIETTHARDGREAIELSHGAAPDLLILDLVLPGVDGYGVIDWLKDDGTWQGLPLVVYSATEPSPEQRERLRMGPTEFMTKSRIAPDEFERRIVALLDSLLAATKGSLPDVA